MEVKKGEFVAVMGPSGSGKSTLLNIIGLLDRPTSGKVYIDGVEVSKLDSRMLAYYRNRKIGFVFQQFNLINRLTVFENVELPLIPRGIPRKIRARLVKEAILKIGGELSWLNKKPNQLSGGQQQRVAIARAIVTKPDILLADEPTGNLDRVSAKQVVQTFIDLNKEGQTVLVVTHDPEVASCTQKIFLIRDGIIVDKIAPDPERCIIKTV
jgi:putative ABC transport system ATP-binding protein